MFSGQLPHYLEPRKQAMQGGELSGQTTVGALPRLAEYRHSQDSPVKVELRFERDQDGRYLVRGRIDTRLHLTCQRCLELVECDVSAQVELALVWSEEQIASLPERYDPWLMTDDKLVLADMLEEELLLALPLAPVHEICPEPLPTPEADETEAQDKADNPFAVLAGLKKDGRQ